MKPYYEQDGITIYNGDCREILPHIKADLVLTDPPYGIGEARGKNRTRSNLAVAKDYGVAAWDDAPPSADTLSLVLAAASRAIVFGGNYFTLPPSACWLVWDKDRTGDFADAELAWTNLKGAVRLKRFRWNGMLQEPGAEREHRQHPTQKPVPVMKWCLGFAPDARVVLDPFMGSGTTLVAAKLEGRKAVGIEIDERYCEIAVRRLKQQVLDFDGLRDEGESPRGLGEVPGHQATLRLEGLCGAQ